MNRAKNLSKAIRVLGGLGILLLSLTLVVGPSHELYAKKKKKKKKGQEEVDPAVAKKKYVFELNKNWSFGYENYKNKQYDRAAKYLGVVAAIDTIDKFPKVYRYLGDSYFKLNNVDSAQVVFEIGTAKYPEDVHLHRMIGFIKSQREQIGDAIASYERVLELEPESIGDWKLIASLYVKEDQIEDAINAYDKVLELAPEDIDAQNNKASLLGSIGDVEGVIESKEKQRAQDPHNGRVRFELGELYFRSDNFDKSIEVFNECLAISPNDVVVIEYVAKSYISLERYDKAIVEYKKILEIEPGDMKTMAAISRAYKDLGRFTSARTYARKALAVDRSYGLAWIALGEAYEASAERCVDQKDGKVEFNDKLVYELAAAQYRRAAKDLAFKQDADRHLSFLQGALPTKEDKFMHKGETKPTGDCYKWLN